MNCISRHVRDRKDQGALVPVLEVDLETIRDQNNLSLHLNPLRPFSFRRHPYCKCQMGKFRLRGRLYQEESKVQDQEG
jgi:hypothetical protein